MAVVDALNRGSRSQVVRQAHAVRPPTLHENDPADLAAIFAGVIDLAAALAGVRS